MNDIYEYLGLFFVILSTTAAIALILILAGVGGYVVYAFARLGFEQKAMEMLARDYFVKLSTDAELSRFHDGKMETKEKLN